MNNTVRLVIGILGAAALAFLATPYAADHLPLGLGSALAAVVGAILHQVNPQSLPPASEES